MSQRISFYFFLAISAAHLLAQLFDNQNFALITKVLLMPSLAFWYYQTTSPKERLNSVLLALLFSWLGDCLLILSKEQAQFFLLGLASFLLAHCHYIYTFIKNGKRFQLNLFSIMIISLTVSYLVSLLSILLPALPSAMKMPVIAYGTILCSTLCASLFLKERLSYHWLFLFLGIVLFITSDSLIALNRFRTDLVQSLPNVSFLIMITYIFAQYWIIKSLSQLQNSNAA